MKTPHTNMLSHRMAQLRSGYFLTHLKWLLAKRFLSPQQMETRVKQKEAQAARTLLAKWRNDMGEKDYVDFSIQENVTMRLWCDSLISQYIFSGNFEMDERSLICSLLKPGDVFVDIGANIGLFTLLASRAVGSHGRVHAFEPTKKTYERLVENVNINSMMNVTCHKVALSKETGVAHFNVSLEGYDGWNSLAAPSQGEKYGIEEVNTIRWDEFAHENELIGKVALMKIDVEGWETQLLKGCAEVFSRADAPVLLVEFTESNARSAGSSCQELYQALTDFGYNLYTWDLQQGTFAKAPLLEYYQYTNYLAAKDIEFVAGILSSSKNTLH